MPVPAVIRERCRAFLGLTSDISYIFPAAFPGGGAHFIFVVTDREVVVISSAMFTRTRPKSVWGRYPRDVRLGPVDVTGAGAFFELGGTSFEVDDEYVAVINAADAEVFSPDTLPQDPLPDL
ncbi:MAG TPA: hypothetical protein VFU43_05905 [Streptosporangiaceae bacterium]|nr:hypothetical protein [Streptosporangiaceae bacterium]